MPRRETGESSQPRATEQGERTQTAFLHETPSMRDVLRHQDAFRAVALPETSDPASPGATPFERRGEKRSAEQAPGTVPESALKVARLREEERPGSISLRSLRVRAHYLLEMGPFSEEANVARQAAMKRPEVKEKHQAAVKAAMKRPEVKEKHQAAVKAALNRPEVKEKHKAALNRPEVQAARVASRKATLEKQKQKQKQEGTGRYAPEVKEKHKAALNRPEVQAARVASWKATLEKQKQKQKQKQEGTGRYAPEVKEKHKAAMKAARNRPEVKEKWQEAYMDKLAKARTDVFAPEELATANSTASQAIGGGKSYAWMNVGKPASQA